MTIRRTGRVVMVLHQTRLMTAGARPTGGSHSNLSMALIGARQIAAPVATAARHRAPMDRTPQTIERAFPPNRLYM